MKNRELKNVTYQLRVLRNVIMNETLSHKVKTFQFFESNAYIRGMLLSSNITLNQFDLTTKYLNRLCEKYDLYIGKYF